VPRVVPSQVCAFIKNLPNYVGPGDIASVGQLGSASLTALLDLVDQIPNELLTMDTVSYTSLVRAKAEIKDTLDIWIANRNAGHSLAPHQIHKSLDPVALIGNALSQCPDESPAPATSELNFVTDPDLRSNLRNDIGAVSRALSNGEWKAATVLAGSVIEALLLWDLQNRQTAPTRNTAIAALVTAGTFSQQPPQNLESWMLHQFIEVSAQIPTIKPATAIEARLAKDFRNLIHPGRAQRLGQTCDRGTAHASFAALDHVVRDLTP
jgi:HAMP domain-containing protein